MGMFFRRLSLFSLLLALGSMILLGGLAYFCWYFEQTQEVELPEAESSSDIFKSPRIVDNVTARSLHVVAYGEKGQLVKCGGYQYDMVLDSNSPRISHHIGFEGKPRWSSITIRYEIPLDVWHTWKEQMETEEQEREANMPWNRFKSWIVSQWPL
jgi:hypothetical protein